MPRLVSLAVALLMSAPTAYGQQADAGEAIQQGTTAMRTGKPADAVAAFERAIAANPQSPDAHLDLGMARLRAGDPDQAAVALTRSLELNPSLHGAHLFLGIAEYQRNDLPAASSALHAELAMAPKNVEALTWLGIVELAADHPEQAAAALDQAATLTPSDPNVLSLEGKAHGQIAQRAYQALYKLDPDSWQVHRALAENYSASGEFEKAIGEYEAAIAKQPNNPDLFEALGEENQKMSRADAATKAYEQELRLNPRSAIALYNLGKMDVETGKPLPGIYLLQQAVDAHASPGPALFYLGLGLSEIGQNEQAANALEKSLASNPSQFIRESTLYQLARIYQRLNRKTDADHALSELKALKSKRAEGPSD